MIAEVGKVVGKDVKSVSQGVDGGHVCLFLQLERISAFYLRIRFAQPFYNGAMYHKVNSVRLPNLGTIPSPEQLQERL